MNLNQNNHPQLTRTANVLALIFALALCAVAAIAQEKAAPSGGKAAQTDDATKGAAIFKIPKGYMAMDKSEIGPMLMLNPKKPAAMFVTYPKKEETTEALRLRLRALAASMFLHDKATDIEWAIKKIQSHPGDGDGTADIATATQGDMQVQVVIYERTTGVRPFVYGYFAMRHAGGKGDDARFIDENGKGVKEFEELWKSFPK
jgi:hypothetical protein